MIKPTIVYINETFPNEIIYESKLGFKKYYRD
jgi:hypothetical protein